MTTDQRIAALERQVAQLRKQLTAGPAVSSFAGTVSTRTVQPGIPVELTGGYDAESGYPWQIRVLGSEGGLVDAGTPLTGEHAWEVGGRTDLTAGQYGWLEPDPAGRGWLLIVSDTAAGGSQSSWKNVVRAATTTSGTLATSFENGDTVDGVTLATGDRILIKNQASPSGNGIYTVNASGAPTRATDADGVNEMVGATAWVSEGTENGDTIWACTTNATITPGSTGTTWVKVYPTQSYLCEVTGYDGGTALHTVKLKQANATTNAIEDVSGPVSFTRCVSTTGFQLVNGTLVEMVPIQNTTPQKYWIAPSVAPAGGTSSSALLGLLDNRQTVEQITSGKLLKTGGFELQSSGANGVDDGRAGITPELIVSPSGTDEYAFGRRLEVLGLAYATAGGIPNAYTPDFPNGSGDLIGPTVYVSDHPESGDGGYAESASYHVTASCTVASPNFFREMWFHVREPGLDASDRAIYVFPGRVAWWDSTGDLASAGQIVPGADTDVGIGMVCRGGMVLSQGLTDPGADSVAGWDEDTDSVVWYAGIPVPVPPPTGTYTLQSVDGVLGWV